MKKLVVFTAILSLFASCGKGDRGELVGVKGKKWHPEKPYGMTLVPGGAFILGKSDDDLASIQDAPTKTVTVRSFYMDETEITNAEYRQFVEWVKDSTIRTRLAILADEVGQGGGEGSDGGIGDYAFADANVEEMSPYDKYMYENYYSIGTEDDNYAGRKLNRKAKLINDPQKYPDEYYVEVMDSMYLPESESYNGLKTIDVSKLKFRFREVDWNKAVTVKGRKDLYKEVPPIEIYPDTTVWIKDFAYSYNEPMHNDYFWHQAYAEYPVVGIKLKHFALGERYIKTHTLKRKKEEIK